MDSRPLRDREEFRKAESGMAGPSGSSRAFVKRRETNLNLTSAIGKTQIISDNGCRQKGGGWFCDVCDCILKDTSSYLDHINGTGATIYIDGIPCF
jgi:U4/U6.U5 tri-snRNP component SNU23